MDSWGRPLTQLYRKGVTDNLEKLLRPEVCAGVSKEKKKKALKEVSRRRQKTCSKARDRAGVFEKLKKFSWVVVEGVKGDSLVSLGRQ